VRKKEKRERKEGGGEKTDANVACAICRIRIVFVVRVAEGKEKKKERGGKGRGKQGTDVVTARDGSINESQPGSAWPAVSGKEEGRGGGPRRSVTSLCLNSGRTEKRGEGGGEEITTDRLPFES